MFSWNTGKKGSHEKGLKIFGANPKEFPLVMALIQVDEHRDRFMFPTSTKDATVDQITQFLEDVKAGKIDKHFKS